MLGLSIVSTKYWKYLVYLFYSKKCMLFGCDTSVGVPRLFIFEGDWRLLHNRKSTVNQCFKTSSIYRLLPPKFQKVPSPSSLWPIPLNVRNIKWPASPAAIANCKYRANTPRIMLIKKFKASLTSVKSRMSSRYSPKANFSRTTQASKIGNACWTNLLMLATRRKKNWGRRTKVKIR